VLIWCVRGDTVPVEMFYIASSRPDTTAVTLGSTQTLTEMRTRDGG